MPGDAAWMRWGIGLGRVLVALALFTTGCGGGSGAAHCGTTQPCGGDVVAAWGFQGTCSNVAAASSDLAADCPGASISANSVALTGGLTFNADLTYTATNWHETFSGNEILPLSCATGVTSCADLGGTVSDSENGTTINITTTCTGTTVCSCRINGNLSVTSDVGTYTIAGTTMTMTGASTSGDFSYCVEESRLHLLQVSTTMTTPTGQAVIKADVVAGKQ
jgi:hypothetical protein